MQRKEDLDTEFVGRREIAFRRTLRSRHEPPLRISQPGHNAGDQFRNTLLLPASALISRKFVPTVAAVYDRRFSLQHAIKPAVIDRRYSGKVSKM